METVSDELSRIASVSRSHRATAHNVVFAAFTDRYLSQEEMERLCYNELEEQRRISILRDDRVITAKEPNETKAVRRGRQRALSQNLSDAMWLEDLKVFESESSAGLEMSDKERCWYDYLKSGTLAGDVLEYVTAFHPALLESSEEPETDDPPF